MRNIFNCRSNNIIKHPHHVSRNRPQDEQELTELNHRLALLESKLQEHPEVSITYFVQDTRKAGGSYVTLSGKVAKISPVERTITMADGQTIAIADVVGVEGEMFDGL